MLLFKLFFPFGVNPHVIEQQSGWLTVFLQSGWTKLYWTPARELRMTSPFAFCELTARKRPLNSKFWLGDCNDPFFLCFRTSWYCIFSCSVFTKQQATLALSKWHLNKQMVFYLRTQKIKKVNIYCQSLVWIERGLIKLKLKANENVT